MARIFESENLREILSSIVRTRKGQGSSITFEKLASAAGLQKAHVSNVLKNRAIFQPDQLYLICHELGLKSDETKYLMLLLEHERSSVEQRKKEIRSEIETLQRKHLRTERHISASITPSADPPDELSSYYLEPLNQILHIAFSIERFSKKPILLCQELGITETRLWQAVEFLTRAGLVKKQDGRYIHGGQKIHLPSASPLYFPWRSQLHNLAETKRSLSAPDTSYGFSVVFSADPNTRKALQAKFLDFLKEVEGEVGGAPCEQVYYLSFDLSSWTER